MIPTLQMINSSVIKEWNKLKNLDTGLILFIVAQQSLYQFKRFAC